MRLESIKLAGFKSFVDPTTVPFPRNLTAVVGPNGCGKSNIIDAVRWVMGESSAKQLRGESLDDVIFNGSTGRKPIAQASIELIFDNSDNTLTGQYAPYTQIALRREITRDGQSSYYLNGTKCRRRDITDLFLGTGLGPRSYAIIEQGTISRIIEAKPDELRSYIEEVAGISKYKERRHETELRIQHTQENLARINDLRDELGRQINHLQRQANAAERYQVLKQEEQACRAQLLALRWRGLDIQLATQTEQIQSQEATLQAAQMTQQDIETQLEQRREQQSSLSADRNRIQAHYYELGTQASRLEQTLQHQSEKRLHAQKEYDEVTRNLQMTHEQLAITVEQGKRLSNEVVACEPVLQQAKQTAEQSQLALTQTEQALREWQTRWDLFNREAAQTAQQAQVEQTRIQHLEQRMQATQQRMNRLEQEYQAIDLTPAETDDLAAQLQALAEQHADGEQQLQQLLQQITAQREHNKQTSVELDNAKSRLQTLRGQQASLQALQKAALGQQNGAVADWLKQQQLAENQRLAQLLQVEAGWETAAEAVLGANLQAIFIENLQSVDFEQIGLPRGNLNLVSKTQVSSIKPRLTHVSTLLEKTQAPFSLAALLSNIYIAETLTDALNLSVELAADEAVVTRSGILLGNGWLSNVAADDAKSGVLQRKRELEELSLLLEEVENHVAMLQEKITSGQQHLHDLEQQRDNQRHEQVSVVAAQADLRARQQVREAHVAQLQKRAQQLGIELQDCRQHLAGDQQTLEDAQSAFLEAQQTLAEQAEQREALLASKTEYQVLFDEARQQAHSHQDAAHQAALSLQAAKLQLDTTEQNHARLEQHLEALQERQQLLQESLNEGEGPLSGLAQQLEEIKAQRKTVEEELQIANQKVEQLDQELRSHERQRQQSEQHLQNTRNTLEQIRLSAQALEVRAKTLQEQLAESGHELQDILQQLTEDLAEPQLEEQLAQITRRIERLGPINLAAIDEFNTQSERKNYLDAQHADLSDALASLENVMQKMDRETRTLFKDTFDKVNQHFQTLFPGLFGGGRATLELTGDDLLEAGVAVMAQPPGKRNSTIHLLSGGEKALTAIALVFSLFQLNPAPFCMLDEVDAPLDDANVGRFCNLVKEMSSKVQFIFISHNKLAIEMAEHLAGVTMKEAGVSRMVAVDIEEAMALAAA